MKLTLDTILDILFYGIDILIHGKEQKYENPYFIKAD